LARRAIDKRHAASGAAWEDWEMPADAGVADILDEMIERQEFRQLHEAVATLPEPYRETLVLHHFEGLPYEAVAELLDCPVGTIRSRLARARAILARKLGKPPGHAGHHDGNENAKGGRTDGVAS
jgi:RNA polymerase sigma factor (sigma-70 family)